MNDLVVIEKIEQRLQKPREENTFPLTPTHRKELRKLRDENVGNLQERLRTIKQLKKEEYQKKYSEDIQKELRNKEKIFLKLNKDWKQRLDQINKIISERKELEDNIEFKYFELDSDYGDIGRLEKIKTRREYSINSKKASLKILEGEFEEKYGKKFEEVQKRIDDIITKYEEAINFGDLNIVKELYYIMKKADSFFEKVEKLDV